MVSFYLRDTIKKNLLGRLVMLHLIIGILAALFLWRVLKSIFKLLIWLIPIGIVSFFLFPHLFLFVGGFGLLALGLLGTLLLIGLVGLFISFDNN
jgi:hypothetical protein